VPVAKRHVLQTILSDVHDGIIVYRLRTAPHELARQSCYQFWLGSEGESRDEDAIRSLSGISPPQVGGQLCSSGISA